MNRANLGPPVNSRPDPHVSQVTVSSPVGPLRLESSDEALVGIRFLGDAPLPPPEDVGRTPDLLAETARQLDEYFAGRRTTFDLPLAPRGTSFQQLVWTTLREIPFGQTTSYGDLARRIGRPSAVRAVGAANGQNPIPIVIPCHRVIGRTGRLVGFGGGLQAKRYLLDLEGRTLF